MYAFAGDYPAAIERFETSYRSWLVDSEEPGALPMYWNAYVDATIAFFGSGSPKTANLNLKVVANEKHMQADKVHVLGFRERQGLSDKAS